MSGEQGSGDVAAALTAALAPITGLAVQVFGPCVAAVVDVFDLTVERGGGPTPGPALTVTSDDRLVDLHATAFALDEGPAAEARRRGEVVVDEVPSRLGARWDLLADDAGLASALSHPLTDPDAARPGVTGVLTLYGSQRPGVRTLDRRAVALLASVVATTIARARDPEPAPFVVALDQLVLDLGVGAVPTIDLRAAAPKRTTAS